MVDHIQNISLPEEQKLAALYQICLNTGAAGQDASKQYHDPKLLGHIYALPYAIFEEQNCLVWYRNQHIKGYCVAAPDTLSFLNKLELNWWPELRRSYQPLLEAGQLDNWSRAEQDLLERSIMRPRAELSAAPPYFCDYPSHLHINLLSECQRQGAGTALILAQLDLLRRSGSSGVHLGVSKENFRALRFYHRLGFTALAGRESGDSYLLGMRLGDVRKDMKAKG
ncbi:MAG: GNAT family N-acetyltransferase [Spirochaetota bacterium]